VIVLRFVIVIAFNRMNAWRRRRLGKEPRASLRQAILVGWCGMRGFVTMATALALPADLPRRDTILLAAFGVVFVTLVVQGMTLNPLIRLLGLDHTSNALEEMKTMRRQLCTVGIATLQQHDDPEAESLRTYYQLQRAGEVATVGQPTLERYRRYGLIALRAERKALEKFREDAELSPDLYLKLQEELDWRELTLLPEEERVIEES
jgi:monovalent cation/hydrogen antiporter